LLKLSIFYNQSLGIPWLQLERYTIRSIRLECKNSRVIAQLWPYINHYRQRMFNYAAYINADGTLERWILIHNNSIKMCQRWSTVFIMDCTCKTNKFGMPLLNIVGITATYNSFRYHKDLFKGHCTWQRIGFDEFNWKSVPINSKSSLYLVHQQEHSSKVQTTCFC
jgi:hypothetical protein